MRLAHFLLFAAACLATLVGRAESLWTSGPGDRSMFADRKASRAGDILTIEVSESVTAQSSQSKKSTRESTVDDAMTQFIYPGSGLHKGKLPSIEFGGKASSTGGGDVSNNQSLMSRAAVLVTDVLPNGNLVIEGGRVVTFSGETQYVVLHGIVRADDISSNNTVFSSNIADARVEFVSKGMLTDAQKRGWFAKLYEKFRPF